MPLQQQLKHLSTHKHSLPLLMLPTTLPFKLLLKHSKQQTLLLRPSQGYKLHSLLHNQPLIVLHLLPHKILQMPPHKLLLKTPKLPLHN